MSCAVEQRGLLQFLWESAEEIQHQNDIADRYGARNDHRPEGIEQMHILDDQIRRNQTAAEQRGNQKEPDIRRPPVEPVRGFGKRICAHDRHQNLNACADDSAQDADNEGPDKGRVLQDIPVGFQIEVDRPERDHACGVRNAVTQRDGQNVDHWQQADQSQKRHHKIVEDQKSLIAL